MRKPVALAALCLLLSSFSIAQPAASTFKVGVAGRAFHPAEPYDWRSAQTHALLATIWYPADPSAAEAPQSIPPDSALFNAGLAARDAKPAPEPRRFPLIALSHGSGGSAIQMAWLGTYLASHGYIAVAVNHPGNNALERYTVQGFSLWWERARDITSVIDHMLADFIFGQRIDRSKIGASGFSLGGYTMIVLAGGLSDPSALIRFCDSPRRDDNCKPIPEFPDIFSRYAELRAADPMFAAAIARAHRSHRDPRIRAVFAIAPAVGPAFTPQDLAPVRIPVEIVAGAADNIVPVSSNAEYFAAHIHGAHLRVLPGGVSHYTFLDTCTSQGRKTIHPYCDDAPSVDRESVHTEVAAMALHFFKSHLR